MRRLRSWMFVPGHSTKMVLKALTLEVDVAMFDLEDSVVPDQKAAAREVVREALGRERSEGEPARYVRVNVTGLHDQRLDLDAVVEPGLDGLIVPKVQTADEVRYLHAYVDALEHTRGMERGRTRLVLAVESPRALLDAYRIAASSTRVSGLMFGAEDFSRTLDLPTVRRGPASELQFARSQIVVAAAAAGVASIDGVWPDLNDATGFVADCEYSRSLGFTGKSLIHPSQIAPINRAFRASESERAFAQKVVTEFEKAMAAGNGSVAVDGQLVDPPIYERAKATLRDSA